MSGKGDIYSYEIVTQAIQPAFADWVPYPVVLVELDEQRGVTWRWGIEDETVSVRLITNLVQPDDPTRPRPRRTWPSVSGSRSASWTSSDDFALPQFRLSTRPPSTPLGGRGRSRRAMTNRAATDECIGAHGGPARRIA